jgi:hypothetical protein
MSTIDNPVLVGFVFPHPETSHHDSGQKSVFKIILKWENKFIQKNLSELNHFPFPKNHSILMKCFQKWLDKTMRLNLSGFFTGRGPNGVKFTL